MSHPPFSSSSFHFSFSGPTRAGSERKPRVNAGSPASSRRGPGSWSRCRGFRGCGLCRTGCGGCAGDRWRSSSPRSQPGRHARPPSPCGASRTTRGWSCAPRTTTGSVQRGSGPPRPRRRLQRSLRWTASTWSAAGSTRWSTVRTSRSTSCSSGTASAS